MKSNSGSLGARKLALVLSCFVLIMAVFALPSMGAMAQDEEPEFTSDFRLEDCRFKTTGENPYFILEPGYQLVLEGEEDGETLRVEITVLNETETVNVPDVGQVKTRVVEEVETVDGELVEISRNFFALCNPTNDVYYFGEEVDIYEEGEIVSHEGAWRAGEPAEDGEVAQPGLIMPGTFLLGSRYYQEIAPGIAEDRAEHVEMGLEVTVAAGTFEDCVLVLETTPLEPGAKSEKTYCPGVGLVIDDVVEQVEHGFTGNGNDNGNDNDDE